MKALLKEIVEGKKIELLINTRIFAQDIALQAAYSFLDRGYFFFDLDADENLILQLSIRDGIEISPETLIAEFSDELLSMSLRDKLEKENKIIRETIVTKAINGPLDTQNFVSLDTTVSHKKQEDEFDEDLNEILSYIGNEPNLNINDKEIENILKEIDTSSQSKK